MRWFDKYTYKKLDNSLSLCPILQDMASKETSFTEKMGKVVFGVGIAYFVVDCLLHPGINVEDSITKLPAIGLIIIGLLILILDKTGKTNK